MQYTYIGIDVSKKSLSIAYFVRNNWKRTTIPNSILELELWLADLSVKNVHFIFEATGTYSSKLAYVLNKQGLRFTILSPQQSSNYSKLRGNSTKNDPRDAQLLSEYGQQFQPTCSTLPQIEEQELQQTLMALRGLEKSRQIFYNQRHALEQLAQPSMDVVAILNENIAFMDNKIAELEKKISDLLETDSLQTISELMLTVKGVGPGIVASIWAEIGNPLRFDSPKQFAKFAGLTPILYSSGKSSKNAGIPKRKGSRLRRNLYMAVMSAIRYNEPCKELFERMRAKNKPERIVHWAVAHKMLRQIWAVVKYGQPFVNSVNFSRK